MIVHQNIVASWSLHIAKLVTIFETISSHHTQLAHPDRLFLKYKSRLESSMLTKLVFLPVN